jgi:hypothetical protein
MIKYSQAGQDKFVLSFFDDDYKGFFIDIGCWMPDDLNNTLRLEERGWFGVSLDITDMKSEWRRRNTPFVCENALTCDYEKLLNSFSMPKVIDYLSLDIEGDGGRYSALLKLFEANHEFKIITIEHDSYRGYGETERKKQREFLTKMGYFLICSNVTLGGNPFEDWWINSKYINEDKYRKLVSEGLSYDEILKKL